MMLSSLQARHRALAEGLAKGQDLKTISESLEMDFEVARRISSSETFKAFVERLRHEQG